MPGVAQQRRLSDLLVYVITPSAPVVASLKPAWHHEADEPIHKMTFKVKCHGQLLTCLFDTGSTHTLTSAAVASRLNLVPMPSEVRALSLVGGEASKVTGKITLPDCSWGGKLRSMIPM